MVITKQIFTEIMYVKDLNSNKFYLKDGRHIHKYMDRVVNSNNFFALLALIIAALLLSGCTTVAPWERGDLAKPHMALTPHPMQSGLRAHNYSSREGAAASSSAGGGGCGCY